MTQVTPDLKMAEEWASSLTLQKHCLCDGAENAARTILWLLAERQRLTTGTLSDRMAAISMTSHSETTKEPTAACLPECYRRADWSGGECVAIHYHVPGCPNAPQAKQETAAADECHLCPCPAFVERRKPTPAEEETHPQAPYPPDPSPAKPSGESNATEPAREEYYVADWAKARANAYRLSSGVDSGDVNLARAYIALLKENERLKAEVGVLQRRWNECVIGAGIVGERDTLKAENERLKAEIKRKTYCEYCDEEATEWTCDKHDSRSDLRAQLAASADRERVQGERVKELEDLIVGLRGPQHPQAMREITHQAEIIAANRPKGETS